LTYWNGIENSPLVSFSMLLNLLVDIDITNVAIVHEEPVLAGRVILRTTPFNLVRTVVLKDCVEEVWRVPKVKITLGIGEACQKTDKK
jgi:hypothetical protein